MSDELKHECAVALVVLKKDAEHYRAKYGTSDFGGTKLSLLLEKQHNRGQDGAGAAIVAANPEAGAAPYQIFKSASATPLADILRLIGKGSRNAKRETQDEGLGDNGSPASCLTQCSSERIFLGHLRYATFGKNDVAYCHPFVHTSSELEHTLLLAGNFNLTNAAELFDGFRREHCFPTSRADGYLICELIAHELQKEGLTIAAALSAALASADGAWTLVGATGDGWTFATRDPHGIRPGWYYADDEVVSVASERPAIQAAFDVPPEAVKELPPGKALVVSPDGDVEFVGLGSRPLYRHCSFERIYFSRANDADIYHERKALGAALVPQILAAANSPMERIFFSYIPNSARIAFYGLVDELFKQALDLKTSDAGRRTAATKVGSPKSGVSTFVPRFGEIAVKDAKFRTFIADAAARREFYKHVYDVTYGLVEKEDTLVVIDDSIVRGNTMKNAILPMLDRLGPKRIVVASSAPPIRYPDCYGIDMSTLGELVAFRALVNLLGPDANAELRACAAPAPSPSLRDLYARFTEEQHCREIARLLTPPGMKAEVVVVYQSVENLRRCLRPTRVSTDSSTDNSQLLTLNSQLPIGDWYFTGDYPTPGGYKVLHQAIFNYLNKNSGRSY